MGTLTIQDAVLGAIPRPPLLAPLRRRLQDDPPARCHPDLLARRAERCAGRPRAAARRLGRLEGTSRPVRLAVGRLPPRPRGTRRNAPSVVTRFRLASSQDPA